MDILQNLLENEILTPETKEQLEEAISSQLSEAVETAVNEAREETETRVRAELAEQFVTDKEALVEALDTKVQQFLDVELAELMEDVENYRDLEAEYADKVVNMKQQLAEVAKKDFAQLVNILNEFLEERVDAEFQELKEDIEEVKKLKFGETIFEAFKDQFLSEHFDKDEFDQKVSKMTTELKNTKEALSEARKELASVERKTALNETLSSLEGKPREVMAAILENTPTEKIESTYKQFIGRVLNESVVEENEAEKENKEVLAEGDSETQSNEKRTLKETVDVSGDTGIDPPVANDDDLRNLSESAANRLRELTGQLD